MPNVVRTAYVAYLPAEAEFHSAGGEFVADGTGVRHGAGDPVEFGDHQGVVFADRGQDLVKSGPVAVDAGQPVVEVDAFLGDAVFT